MRTCVDFHQVSYGRPSVPLWTSISFHTDINHYLCGCPSAFLWTSIRTFVDVHQLSYGRPSVFVLTSVSFILTSICTSLDFHQVSYGCPSVPLWTSISFHKDIRKNLCGRSSAFVRTFISTSVDIFQFSSRHASSLRTSISYLTDHKTSVDVHQLSYGRL